MFFNFDIYHSKNWFALIVEFLLLKTHKQHIEELDDASTSALLITTKKISERIRDKLNYPATTIGINNGPDAGQEIGHVHIHIIPRKKSEDGGGPFSIVLANGRIDKPSDKELDELSTTLKF